MQAHKRLFTLFLIPNVSFSSPPEEMVKGHWVSKHGQMGWAAHTAISSPPVQRPNRGEGRLGSVASPKGAPPSRRDSGPLPHMREEASKWTTEK